MSYCLMPFAVDLDKLQAAIGSKDKKLVTGVAKKFRQNFAEINEMAADYADDEAEAPKVQGALEQMIQGAEYDEGFGFLYGYALEYLTWHLGTMLTNEHWSAMRGEWFETVDKALEKAGVPEKTLRMTTVAYGGSPVEIPPIDDFPAIGFLKKPQIAKALAALTDEATVAKLAKAKPEVRDAIDVVRSWLETCTTAKCDLVCFYS